LFSLSDLKANIPKQILQTKQSKVKQKHKQRQIKGKSTALKPHSNTSGCLFTGIEEKSFVVAGIL